MKAPYSKSNNVYFLQPAPLSRPPMTQIPPLDLIQPREFTQSVLSFTLMLMLDMFVHYQTKSFFAHRVHRVRISLWNI